MNSIIAAVATGQSVGGIAIIRLSGLDVLKVANQFFKFSILELKPNTITYNHIIENDEYVDEILVSFFKGPNSFTGEDVLEINCHGGIVITRYILEMLLGCDEIQMAAPGEFSKRAFLNGKKTLQASKAIEEIINATNLTSLKMSQQMSLDKTTVLIESLRNDLLDIVANIEVNIDYPEYEDINQVKANQILNPARDFLTQIEAIIYDSMRGEVIKKGITTAIIGAPNVGKSSLLNLLSNSSKAIVTDIAGTTRDIVESQITLGNISLNLLDTAGIRKTDDVVEKIGVEKSYDAARNAQMVLFLVDGSRVITNSELELYSKISSKPHLVLITKSDLPQVIDQSHFKQAITITTKDKFDLKQLEIKISEIFDLVNFDPVTTNYVSGVDDISKLKQVRSYIFSAIEQLEIDMPIDIVEIDIKEALFALGQIISIDPEKNLIDELFSRFCLGK